MSFNITSIAALQDNYIWMIACPEQKRAIVVDPGEAAPVLAMLKSQQFELAGILITHHHWDHVNGVAELLRQYAVPVYGPSPEICSVDVLALGKKHLVLPELSLDFQVLAIPGHTLDHVAYYGNGNLFCGDTLFTGGCGRVFEGTHEQMYDSLCQLTALPDETQVYCGHEYTENNLRFALMVEPNNHDLQQRMKQIQALRAKKLSTVPATMGEEKLTNPFLRCTVSAVIAAAEQHAKQKLQNPVEVFACLRQWKNGF